MAKTLGVAVVAFFGFHLEGGPISRVRGLAWGMSRAGARVHILAFGVEPHATDGLESRQIWKGIPVHQFCPERSWKITARTSLGRARQKLQRERMQVRQRRRLLSYLEKLGREGSVHVALLHGQQFGQSLEMLAACRKGGIKMVQQYTEQHLPADYKGGCFHPYWIREFLHGRIFPKLADANLPICSFLVDWCRQRSSRPCLMIPTIITPDLEPISVKTDTSHKCPLTFGYIGPGARRDCVEQMIEGARLLKEKALPFRLVLAGLYPSVLERNRTQVKRLGLEGAVELHGWIDESRLRRFWTEIPVFMILRTDDRSSRACFPGRIGEYAAYGRALILTDIPDYNLHFRHRESAMLVAPGGAEGLANAMADLIQSPALVAQLGRAAGALAATTFSSEVRGSELLQWLSSHVVQSSGV
jgi:glycosyltransferase involved in cell wall biosynthesis